MKTSKTNSGAQNPTEAKEIEVIICDFIVDAEKNELIELINTVSIELIELIYK